MAIRAGKQINPNKISPANGLSKTPINQGSMPNIMQPFKPGQP